MKRLPKALMFQTGYLTIEDYSSASKHYLGLNIDSKDRNIDSWAGVLLYERGEGSCIPAKRQKIPFKFDKLLL